MNRIVKGLGLLFVSAIMAVGMFIGNGLAAGTSVQRDIDAVTAILAIPCVINAIWGYWCLFTAKG